MPRSLYCSLSRQCKYGKGYGKSGNPYMGAAERAEDEKGERGEEEEQVERMTA